MSGAAYTLLRRVGHASTVARMDHIQAFELEQRASAAVALAACQDSRITDREDMAAAFAARGFGRYTSHIKALGGDPLLSTDAGVAALRATYPNLPERDHTIEGDRSSPF